MGRHCLWTICRQIPVIMMTLPPMMATMRLLYPAVGLEWALAGGWAVFLCILVPVAIRQHTARASAEEEHAASAE